MHPPSTRRSNRVGRFKPSTGGGRVGRSHRFEKTARKREKTQIRRINADSGDSFPNSGEISLRSRKNLTGFDEISLDPVKISLDLREISPESEFFRQILENYHRILEILAGICKFLPESGNL